MQTTLAGETIRFHSTWIDGLGAFVDPPEVMARVMRTSISPVYGPFAYTTGQVQRSSTGFYFVDVDIEPFLTPGNYSVKWEGVVDGDESVQWEQFQVVEPDPTPSELLDPPRLYGQIIETNTYRNMGVGETDNIFLVGHADGIGINSPYQVVSIKEAVQLIGGDLNCPLLRGLLEAYNAGARDIWLVASAPMSEYVPWDPNDPKNLRFVGHDEWGGLNFYERYQERLQTTYELLLDYEAVDFLVPLEAPFYYTGDVDFFSDLVFNCFDRFEKTGYVSIGIMGTLIGQITSDDIAALKTQSHFDELGNMEDYYAYMLATRGIEFARDNIENAVHKFGMVVFGETAVTLPQAPAAYSTSVAALAAGVLSALPYNRGLTYVNLPHATKPFGKPLKREEVKELAASRINPLIQTAQGRRGEPYRCVLASDNLASPYGSDFWTVSSMRLVSKIVKEIKFLGNISLGTIRYPQFKREVDDLLKLFVRRGFIRDYQLNITRAPSSEDLNQTVYVELVLTPYIGVRELYFQVKVTPGE